MENEEIVKGILITFLPQILVKKNLDELYINDQQAALKILREIFNNKDSINKELNILLELSFTSKRNSILHVIDNIDDLMFTKCPEMYLIYSLSIFEAMINDFVHIELSNKLKSGNINDIIKKLSITDKLGWFLELLTGHSFIRECSDKWGKIKPYIETRNFFIHYKPEEIDKYEKHQEKLSKKSIKNFLDVAFECESFLKEIHSEDTLNMNKRIDNISKLIESSFS